MLEMFANIDVDDLERAVQFYVGAFDLSVGRRLEAFAAIELLGASSRIFLLGKAQGTAPSANSRMLRDYHRHWTPVHLDFVVKDIEAAVRRAVGAGATLESGPETLEWGRIAMMADPFGHGLCLLQFIGRGYDEIVEPRSKPR